MYKFMYEHKFSFFLDKYLREKLFAWFHGKYCIYVTYKKLLDLSKVAVPFCIPIINIIRVPFALHCCQHLVLSVFLI